MNEIQTLSINSEDKNVFMEQYCPGNSNGLIPEIRLGNQAVRN